MTIVHDLFCADSRGVRPIRTPDPAGPSMATTTSPLPSTGSSPPNPTTFTWPPYSTGGHTRTMPEPEAPAAQSTRYPSPNPPPVSPSPVTEFSVGTSFE